ncbi:MAG: ADP-forming succinate--CoA ligase subunit beta [Candidatus Eisenbacteria bacterium]|nr:ADP-forming succinate--CoA ligase subunit beta [Candidatus Eisenbacteria bacterium]
MNIQEYQAKELFRAHGIPTTMGEVARTPEEARDVAARIGKPVVVKAQVLVGGRGKAGGIKLAKDPQEAHEKAAQILGMEIKGLTVREVLVAEAADIATEVYLAILVDRRRKKPLLMTCAEGGVDIEEVARRSPEKILTLAIDPDYGLQAFQARQVMMRVAPDARAGLAMAKIAVQLYQVFSREDCSLAEINPLIVTPDGRVLALDAKVGLDDNAEMRHLQVHTSYRPSETEGERLAREAGLSYVKLDGDIGCVVNGAGLAMATMDLVQHFGGKPANFLDIGGSSSPEKVTTAMKIILSDPNVKAVLFNIFGGITRCDDVARGIVEALQNMKVNLPVTVRLTGTNEEEARRILESVNLQATSSMDEGVQAAIASAREARA